MTPFIQKFQDCAIEELLVLRIQEKGLSLPPGEYGFFEWFCEDKNCDCRRVLLQVISPQRTGQILATINYGWESAEFYTRCMDGDEEEGRDLTSATLDPINTQSDLADALLNGFRDYVRHDSYYPQQLQRHYEMYKSTLQHAPSATPTQPMPLTMTTDEILRQLQHVPDQADFAPYETALRAATEQREAITPALLAALDRASADPAYYLKNYEDCLHLFAIYLLAQFREIRALDAFIRFFSLPGEDALNMTGDMVTENGAAVIASVCGGDPAPLLRLAHDEAVIEFVRSQAIDGLLVQSLWGERPRPAVIEDLRRLFSTLPKPGNAYLWASLAGAVCDFNAPELLAEVRQAFAEELVDESIIGLEDVERSLLGVDAHTLPTGEQDLEYFRERNVPIDAVAECSMWLCFSEEDDGNYEDEEEDYPLLGESRGYGPAPAPAPPYIPPPPPVPYIAPPKTGRNDLCPCGSGKKYKKCCGQT